MVYHLWSVPHKVSLVLKVMLPRWKNDAAGELPEVPTVSDVWRTADWHEREVYRLERRAIHRPSRTCGGSSARKIGSAIRCEKTTKCRWSITAFGEIID